MSSNDICLLQEHKTHGSTNNTLSLDPRVDKQVETQVRSYDIQVLSMASKVVDESNQIIKMYGVFL